jgi:hypothetical protein
MQPKRLICAFVGLAAVVSAVAMQPRRLICAVVGLAAVASSRQSVRKEIRNLTEAELDQFVHAMWTLKTTDAAAGVAKYGAPSPPAV